MKSNIGTGKLQIRNLISVSIIAFIVTAALLAADVMSGEASFATSSWPSYRGNDEYNAVVPYELPTEQAETEPAWIKNFDETTDGMSRWQLAPNIPIVIDGDVVTTTGKSVIKINPDTGETTMSEPIDAASNWGYTPMTADVLSDGTKVIFLPLAGGTIEAVRADNLKKIWTFKAAEKNADGTYKWGLTSERDFNPETDQDESGNVKEDVKVTEDGTVLVENLAHQSLSPITYHDGIIYTGFFSGSYNYYDYYVAIAAEKVTIDDKEYQPGELIWKYKSKGGFYWNGAQVVGKALIVGTQDGRDNNDPTGAMGQKTDDSHLLAFDLKTGEIISDVLLEDASDICSSIVYDKDGTGRYFFTSCSGMIHSAEIDQTTGEIIDVKTAKLEAEQSLTVNTPIIYDGRIYLGYKPKKGAYGYYAAYDAKSLVNIFKVELRGYPKGSAVITTAYEKEIEGRPETGWLYAYVPYYEEPGGLQLVKFRPDATDGSDTNQVQVTELFEANGYEQYAACGMVADDRGHLYYKNDSNSLFAVRKGSKVEVIKVTGLKLKASANKVTVSMNKVEGATQYRVLYRINNKGAFTKVDFDTNKGTIEVPIGSIVTVRARAEYVDAAKASYGDYSDDVSTFAAKSTIKKLKAAKKSFTVKYDKHKMADGYQIQYSLKKNMKSARKVTAKKASKVSVKVKKLKAKKKYFVRVRSYVKVDGKTLYGTWSTIKKVKTK